MRSIRIALLLAALALLLVPALVGGAEKTVNLAKPFQHDTHLKELRKEGDRKLTCKDCHALTSTSGAQANVICEKIRMPYPTHDKCTSCHPTAFFKKPLVICTNCHVSVSFTSLAPMKEQTGHSMTPLRSEFSHKLHLDPKQRVKKMVGVNKDCTFCHQFKDGGKTVTRPSHQQCCECHTKKDVTPNINDCAACHARPAEHAAPVSLVVKKYSHADHQTDPRTNQTLDCRTCHTRVDKAASVRDIVMPEMATCVGCHAGQVAFDYVQCLKCHGPEIEKRAVPESHKKKT